MIQFSQFNGSDKMVKIVDNLKDANAVTHSGTFHADDIFSTVLLEYIFDDLYIFRTYEITAKNDSRIYYDIGGGKFDHHHNHNNKMRNEFIPYASFGLLWEEYAKTFLEKIGCNNIEYVSKYVIDNLITCIDAVDNGVFYNCDMYNILDVSKIISLFNPRYDEEIDSDTKFIEACNFAKIIFDNIVNNGISMAKSKSIVENKIRTVKNHMIILDEYVPFKEHILNSKLPEANNIYFVIYKSSRKGYMIATLPKNIDDNELRMKFPEKWAGLREKNFSDVCNIDNVIFCHKNLFVAAAHTLDSAIKIVEETIRINNKL